MKTIIANDGKQYSLPSKPHWRSGFPSAPGWYPASLVQNIKLLRFFNGAKWSIGIGPFDTEITAADIGIVMRKDDIEWTDPWWTPEAQAKIKAGA